MSWHAALHNCFANLHGHFLVAHIDWQTQLIIIELLILVLLVLVVLLLAKLARECSLLL